MQRWTVAAKLDGPHTRDDLAFRRRQNGDQLNEGRGGRRNGTHGNRDGDDAAVGGLFTLDVSLAIDIFVMMNGGTVMMIVVAVFWCSVDVKCAGLRLKDAD